MKRLYIVSLRDTHARFDPQEFHPFLGHGGPSIRVAASSFTEAIEETQKRYGPRYEVVGVQHLDMAPSGPRDIL